jgi:methanogenesis marker radical SAM protein
MMINAPLGGTPGKDCGGFCKFCYFRGVDYDNLDSLSIGCRYCPPHQVGCDHCHEVINDIKNGFRPLSRVLSHLENILRWHEVLGTLDYKNLKVVTASMADVTSYPQLFELLTTLKDQGFLVHLGYTSGKCIKDGKTAEKLVSRGTDEINFSLVSMDPEIRRRWMGDRTPEESIKALQTFCESVEVNVSTVVIPGVITEEDLFGTCTKLEEWGIKSFILSRFVNFKKEGLIYNNRPVIMGMKTQPFPEFQELVKMVDDAFPFKVIGSPDTLYKLSKKENRRYLNNLPEVRGEATIITSQLSCKPLEEIFKVISPDKVNVIGVDKEIGDLITMEDLETVDLGMVKEKVILPGGALVHDRVARKIFNKDGLKRKVIRGPTSLFYFDVEFLNQDSNLEHEFLNFNALIKKINSS